MENLNATELVISKLYSAGTTGTLRSSANIKISPVSNMALMLLFFKILLLKFDYKCNFLRKSYFKKEPVLIKNRKIIHKVIKVKFWNVISIPTLS